MTATDGRAGNTEVGTSFAVFIGSPSADVCLSHLSGQLLVGIRCETQFWIGV